LSVLVKPLPPSPLLDQTWKRYIGCLEDRIANEEYAADIKDDLETTVQFITILRENEPRFLMQQGFPTQQQDLLSSCLAVIGDYDYRDSSPKTIEELDEVSQYLEELESICTDISEICPNLGDNATDAAAGLEGQRDRANEAREKIEQQAKDEERAEQESRDMEDYYRWMSQQAVERPDPPIQRPQATHRPSRASLLVDELLTVDPLQHLFDDL